MIRTLQHLILVIALLLSCSTNAHAQAYVEDFPNPRNTPGWASVNASQPSGRGKWATYPYAVQAFNGPDSAYAGSTHTAVTSVGTLSNWLFSPERTLNNGDVLSFYSRQTADALGVRKADRLEVRMSPSGVHTSTFSTAHDLGTYTTLLLTINPDLELTGYPIVWTRYTITVSGLAGPVTGRFAFRHFVTNAGAAGSHGSFIGIDHVVYTPHGMCGILSYTTPPASTATLGQPYSTQLGVSGNTGAVGYSVTAGALPPGITLTAAGLLAGTPTTGGSYNFTVRTIDALGCNLSTAFSITVACPSVAASLTLPSACSTDAPLLPTGGSPAGGTYSASTMVDGYLVPASGNVAVSYTVPTGPGCTATATATFRVTPTPVVTLPGFSVHCTSAGPLVLPAAEPAGGNWSGTNVVSGTLPATVGTHEVIYTATVNGCTARDSANVTIVANPSVVLTALAERCADAPAASLHATPTGGTWTGTGVAGTVHSSVAGTHNLVYTYTDANGCSALGSINAVVHALPVVSLPSFAALCADADPIQLTGALPAGGNWQGAGVLDGSFTPTVGEHALHYSVTDLNGCTAQDSLTVVVHALPTVSLSAMAPLCATGGNVPLTGASPAGGTWSGEQVIDGELLATPGSYTVAYAYTDANGCSASASMEVEVLGLPAVSYSFGDVPVCFDRTAFDLSGGLPEGGSYNGTGVQDNRFDPSVAGVGEHLLTYTWTDGAGCSSSATSVALVQICMGVETPEATTLRVYPNPSSGLFHLEGDMRNAVVFDLNGSRCPIQPMLQHEGIYTLDLSGYPAGIYMLRAISNDRVNTTRLLKF